MAKDFVVMVTDRERTAEMLLRVLKERREQDLKWGPQSHPDINGPEDSFVDPPEDWRMNYDEAVKEGMLCWADIAMEEVSEVIWAESDEERLIECIQAAAVFVNWAEDILSRGEKDDQ